MCNSRLLLIPGNGQRLAYPGAVFYIDLKAQAHTASPGCADTGMVTSPGHKADLSVCARPFPLGPCVWNHRTRLGNVELFPHQSLWERGWVARPKGRRRSCPVPVKLPAVPGGGLKPTQPQSCCYCFVVVVVFKKDCQHVKRNSWFFAVY